MPIDFGTAIAQGGGYLVPTQWAIRAQIQWARILDKPTDITIRRGNRTLDPQTVRLEQDNNYPQSATDASGSSAVRRFILFGVRGHPTIDDLDIDAWDTWVMEEQEYTVISVNRAIIGSIQAVVEAIG
jgi:hypothetical protein